MKKRITVISLLAVLVLSMTGCGNKSVVHIAVKDIGDYEVLQFPSNCVNYSKTDEVITITVKADGDYDFVVQGDDEQKYSFTLKYQDKSAEVQTDDDITVNLSIE